LLTALSSTINKPLVRKPPATAGGSDPYFYS
jgi:hypothetical protein